MTMAEAASTSHYFDARELMALHAITWHPHGPGSHGATDGVSICLEHVIEVSWYTRLHTEQWQLSSEVLAHYRSHDLSERFPGTWPGYEFEQETASWRPTVMSYRGELWLLDGNHRAVAGRERGDPSFTAWHVDPERDRREFEEWLRQGRAAGKGQ